MAIETDDVVLILSDPLDVPTALAIGRGHAPQDSPEPGLGGPGPATPAGVDVAPGQKEEGRSTPCAAWPSI